MRARAAKRGPWRPGSALLAIVAVVAVACGAPGSTTTADGELSPPSPPAPHASVAEPALLVADQHGIRVVEAGAVTRRFLDGPATLAVPDLTGGVVFQNVVHGPTDLVWDQALGRNVLRWDEGGPDPILRIRGEGAAPERIVSHPDARLSLVDVVLVDGRPHVLYRSLVGGAATSSAAWDIVLEWLALYDLERGETAVLGLIGSYESSYTELRIGGEMVAITFHPYGETDARIGRMPVSAIEETDEEDWLPTIAEGHLTHRATDRCPSAGFYCEGWAIASAASDGSRIAWVQGGHHVDEDGTVEAWSIELVTVNAEPGAVTRRVDLGAISVPAAAPEERPGFIDADSSFVLVSRVGPDRSVVLVMPDGEVRELDLHGVIATLWEDGTGRGGTTAR